jgi:hypothetical protein
MQMARRTLIKYAPPLMPHFSPDDIAAVALTLLAGSEILSFLPGVKANGWVQLILGILRGIASTKR